LRFYFPFELEEWEELVEHESRRIKHFEEFYLLLKYFDPVADYGDIKYMFDFHIKLLDGLDNPIVYIDDVITDEFIFNELYRACLNWDQIDRLRSLVADIIRKWF
jgi:hypothetical protein